MLRKLLFLAIAAVGSPIWAQDVLTVDAATKGITAEQAGQYDRVTENWKMEAGKAYLFTLPAQLDGYYFGPNAKRWKVTSYEIGADSTYIVNVADMADLDDFQPNEAYLVTPVIDIDSISHIHAGIKTEAEATPHGKALLHVSEEHLTTGIKPILVGKEGNKVTAIYDLQGQRVSSVRKGNVYIINGKKVIIK